MGHSVGDGIIVASLAALFFGYLFLKYRTRIKRLELIHEERLTAMDKDFPLPELPMDPPKEKSPFNPFVPLILGIVLIMFGGGTMVALRFTLDAELQKLWLMPLPLTLVGIGLVVAFRLTHSRKA